MVLRLTYLSVDSQSKFNFSQFIYFKTCLFGFLIKFGLIQRKKLFPLISLLAPKSLWVAVLLYYHL